jgi:hypothetical protein
MNEEASRYLQHYGTSRIPYIGRQNSILFVDRLYKKNALSVSVSATGVNQFIIEILVICGNSNSVKNILLEILKAKPYAIEESRRNCFRVKWRLGWEEF